MYSASGRSCRENELSVLKNVNMRAGCVCFTPGLEQVLCVKYEGRDGWSFPYSSCSDVNSIYAASAAHTLKRCTGVDVQLEAHRWIQVNYFNPLSDT